MVRINEGKLMFTFPADWQVSKYDTWSYYRNQFKDCCTGCKAVDFIAVCQGEKKEVWLIEVKDYNLHPRTKPSDLPVELAHKVRDSLSGMAAALFQAQDREEKRFARKALQCKKIRVALHLEQPQKHSKLFPRAIDPSKVLQKMKALMKPIDPHPVVVERGNSQIKAWWSVQSLDDGHRGR